MRCANSGAAPGSASEPRDRGRSSRRILGIITACALGAVAGSSGGCRESPAPAAPPPPEVDVARPIVREITEWDEYTGRLGGDRHRGSPAARQRLPRIGSLQGRPDRQEGRSAVRDRSAPVPRRAGCGRGRGSRRTDPARAGAERCAAHARTSFRKAPSPPRNSIAGARPRSRRKPLSTPPGPGWTRRSSISSSPKCERRSTAAPATTSSPSAIWSPAAFRVAANPRCSRPSSRWIRSTATSTPASRTISSTRGSRPSGSRPSSRDKANPVRVALVDETDFTHEGSMDFVDNRIDPLTGDDARPRRA